MHIDMEPMDKPEHDDEGRMAKADLYKLANYSLKLFKQLEDNQQLEGWIQAKITKAADYIASVYHYMEYEMKFSEYGKAIEDSDVYTESQKRQLKNKLFEAKEKVKELKKAQAEKMKKKENKDVDESKKSKKNDGNLANNAKPYDKVTKGDVVAGRLGKDEMGGKNKKVAEDWPGTKEYKAKHGSEKEKHQAKYGKDEELEKEYEARKKKGGYGKLGPSGSDSDEEAAKDRPGRGRKKSNEGISEADKKPSAGMSKAEKSAVVKKAKAGGDIGKPGKGFEKVEKAAKAGGAKDPKAVAAAAMWKQQAKK
jgi:hypothetical protein